MTVLTYVPERVGEGFFRDVPVPGSGDDDKALTYDHATGKFVYAAFDAAGTAAVAVAAHVAASDPHTGYLLADGTRTGASSQRQTFTNGIITGTIRPASDSATAVQVQNAAGSSDVLTVDTTNHAVRVTNANGYISFEDYGIAAYSRIGGNANLVFANNTLSSRAYFFQGSSVDMSSTTFQYMSTQVWDGAATLAKVGNYIQLNLSSASISLNVKAYASQTANLQEWQADSGNVLVSVGASGITAVGPRSAITNAVQNNLIIGHNTSGTPTSGFGLGIAARLESSTMEDRDAGRLSYEWVTATDASRASRGKLSAYYTSTEQEAMRWDGDTGGLKLGFYGQTAVARQTLATGAGATVDDVIQALQNLGLVKQS